MSRFLYFPSKLNPVLSSSWGNRRTYLSCLFNTVFTIYLLSSAPAYARPDIDQPLTAHGNYHNVITHGGLTWTPDKILGDNILVINSYHEGDKKTDASMIGIYRVFQKSGKPINLYVEYMDAIRYSSDYHNNYLAQLYKYKYSNKKLDAIIVSGIEALQFVKNHQSEIFHTIPVIFSGIRNSELRALADRKGVTGILESADAVATIELALKLHPHVNRVLILSPGKHNSDILHKVKEELRSNVKLYYWYDLYNSDIEKKLESIDKDTIILPVAEPRTKAGTSIPYPDFISRIAKITNAPVYSLRDTALGTGAVGGKLISGYDQGAASAEITLRILAGGYINEIPVRNKNLNRYMFDYEKIKLFNIDTDLLPENSIVINDTYSLYKTYQKEINSALILLIIQAAIIFMLILTNKKRKQAEQTLKEINDDLELRISQRTADIASANELLLKEIEDRKQAEKALSISKEKFSKAFHACPDGITITNLSDDRLLEVNEVFEIYSEYTRNEAIGKSSLELGLWCDPDDRKKLIDKIKKEGACRDMEVKLKSRSGRIYNTLIAADTINITGNACLLTIARDITEHKRIYTELRRYEKIVSSTRDCISFVDTDYIYQAVNKSFLNTLKIKKENIIGCHLAEIHGEEKFNNIIKPHLDRCLSGITVNLQDKIDLPRSGERHFDILYSPYYENDVVTGVVITARDMTHTHELSTQLAYQASHDELTGLLNRREFEKRLRRAVNDVINSHEQHVLCYMDLDQFKVLNDNCGHAAGDELLRQLGKMLRQSVRPQDTLARLGGDEFAAIIDNCTIKKAQEIVNNLLATIDNFRFEWENKTYRVGSSIGLVPVTVHSGNINELLKQADAACYVAKNEGRNRMRLYKQNDARLERHHFEMQGILHVQSALDENRLHLFKQPIIPLNGDSATGGEHYEILVRLEKDGEIFTPDIFLPAAEQYGFSGMVDTWVINKIFTWLTEELERQESLSLCSINLSGYSLSTDSLLDFIIERLDHLPIMPEKICFEITETATIANYDKASHFIKELRGRGCHFALDDFGSGFSSFAYLKNLKVDFLKIDGMFIRDMLTDPIAYSMVKSINEIGHIAGIKTVAEFVENDQILQKLREIKIDYAQGYAIGMPHPLDDSMAISTLAKGTSFTDNKNITTH